MDGARQVGADVHARGVGVERRVHPLARGVAEVEGHVVSARFEGVRRRREVIDDGLTLGDDIRDGAVGRRLRALRAARGQQPRRERASGTSATHH